MGSVNLSSAVLGCKLSSDIFRYWIFHNYIRLHEALKGQTPAEACGIKVEGNNKWLTLIQNACRNQILKPETPFKP